EPGGMQTDWAGSSMEVAPVSEPYQPTVGAMTAVHGDLGRDALGDPAKVAQVVLADAAWHDLTVSTDRDDATAAQRDPLGTAGPLGPARVSAGSASQQEEHRRVSRS
ncbi:MAG TPA: hypothetical protein VGD91_23995, partial [Trebonia sp.]